MFNLIALFSAIMFLGTFLLIPWLVVRLPEDYFSEAYQKRELQHSRWLLTLKNIIGIVLIVAGVFMLVLPGQGILTILVGLMMSNFRGKYKVERWFVKHHSVLHMINWIRKKANKKPLIV